MSGVISKNKILVLGGSGTLGTALKNNSEFKNADFPKRSDLDLLNIKTLNKFIKRDYNLIINCAGLARIRECENYKINATKSNIQSIINLVREIKNYESETKKRIRLIHISSDVVYKADKGNYKETDKLDPQNFYGFTKMVSEQIVNTLKNYIIIRTRFFNKKNLKYDNAATDIYSSMVEVEDLADKIAKIVKTKFKGILNVGGKKSSDFQKIVKFLPQLKKISWKNIQRENSVNISKNSTLNINLYKKITKEIN